MEILLLGMLYKVYVFIDIISSGVVSGARSNGSRMMKTSILVGARPLCLRCSTTCHMSWQRGLSLKMSIGPRIFYNVQKAWFETKYAKEFGLMLCSAV